MSGAPLTAQDIAAALGAGKPLGGTKPYWMARCPAHDDGTPSLSIRDGDVRVLLTCFAGCDRRDIWAELRRSGLIDGCDAERRLCRPAPQRQPVPSSWSTIDRVMAIWRRAPPIVGTPVEGYLRGRGCAMPVDADLRYLPPSARWPWPTMVALVTDFASGMPMSLHFTRLEPSGLGKAQVDRPKRLLAGAQKRGSVIRLTPEAHVERQLGLAEGIETALAVAAALGASSSWLPVWATVDAGNMAVLPVVDGIERLTIFADADPAGRTAADRLAARWHCAGREVFIATPAAGDWNEVAA